jgi:hypothetical protein
VSISCYDYDFDDQLDWKILSPFNKIKTNISDILRKLNNNADPFAWSPESLPILCESNHAGLLDEERLHGCILLARYMKENKLLKAGRFDWGTSQYTFSAIRQLPELSAVMQWLDEYEKKLKDSLDDIQKFCSSSNCRNKFLQIHFSGNAGSKRKCMCCDNCGEYNLEKHLKYAADLGSVFENALPLFTLGRFNGNGENFIKYLQDISSEDISAQLAYLHKEERESMRQFSDAAMAALLLEVRQKQYTSETMENISCWQKTKTRENILKDIPLAVLLENSGLPETDKILDYMKTFGKLKEKYPDFTLLQTSQEFLKKCAALTDKLQIFNDKAIKKALKAWSKSTLPDAVDFIFYDKWRDYIADIVNNRIIKTQIPPDNTDAEAAEIRKLKAFLPSLIAIKREAPEKYRQLETIVQTLPERAKREWQLILSVPEDFAKITTDSNEDILWLKNSPAQNSDLLPVREAKEAMVIYELDKAASQMPVENWLETGELLPLTIKFYPLCEDFILLADELALSDKFINNLPEDANNLFQKLPYFIQVFFKKKLIFGNKKKQILKSFADL